MANKRSDIEILDYLRNNIKKWDYPNCSASPHHNIFIVINNIYNLRNIKKAELICYD